MAKSIVRAGSSFHSKIESLEKEIAMLESEIQDVESIVNTFQSQIRLQLHRQIRRIRELASLYKSQKKTKKEKRLQQKQRGKNHKEPAVPKRLPMRSGNRLNANNVHELKRLYKEAIVHVHPDKFVQADADKNGKATALTVQLISLYEKGALDEMKDFHEYIISGNAMSHVPHEPASIEGPEVMINFLERKKQALIKMLGQNKELELYKVLKTYPEPRKFIYELDLQFQQRIIQLEKRTRIKKK
jgi:hypothetical protein